LKISFPSCEKKISTMKSPRKTLSEKEWVEGIPSKKGGGEAKIFQGLGEKGKGDGRPLLQGRRQKKKGIP